MKRPDGFLVEEYITATVHQFEGGELQCHDGETNRGRYTGRFYFEYSGSGVVTDWYTKKNAPQWLLDLYNEARGALQKP